jgi:chitinase
MLVRMDITWSVYSKLKAAERRFSLTFLSSVQNAGTRRLAGICLLAVALLSVPRIAKAQNAPAWKPGVEYEVNEIVSFNATTYKCLQAHKSDNANQPSNVPAIWQPLGNGANCQIVPGAPTGLSTFSTTSTATQLSWKPALAPAGCTVSKYTVFQNGQPIGEVESTTFAARRLTPATQYTFTVTVTDSAGTSDQSAPAVATTKQTPTCLQPPPVPADLAATSTTNTGTTLIWTAPTAVSGCDVPGYAVYKNGVHLGTATGPHFTVTDLSPGTTYTFTVAGTDAAGDSAQSAPLRVTTTKSEP